MFTHCNVIFRPHETWFLVDTDKFTNRKFHLGTCPVCKKGFGALIETRINDGAIFTDIVQGNKLDKFTEKFIREVNYTSEDVKKFKTSLYGLCYGENKEIHNSKGDVIEIRQRRCDFFGNKKIILSISV
ncbi:hypothetical protein IJ750_02615 [bacterium]|nr:hypothetical protein [bacterium]